MDIEIEIEVRSKDKNSGMVMELGRSAGSFDLLFHQRGSTMCWIDNRIIWSSQAKIRIAINRSRHFCL